MNRSRGPNEWPSVLRAIPRAVLLFFRAAPFLSTLQAAITMVRAVVPLLVLGVAKLFVDAATQLVTGAVVVLPVIGVPAEPLHGLYLLGVALLSVWVLDKATWGAEVVVRTYSTNRVESHVHALIMRKCATLDAAFYESPRYLDLLERAVRGALMNSLSFMWGSIPPERCDLAGCHLGDSVDDSLGDPRGDGRFGASATDRHKPLFQARLGTGEQLGDPLPAPEVSHRGNRH